MEKKDILVFKKLIDYYYHSTVCYGDVIFILKNVVNDIILSVDKSNKIYPNSILHLDQDIIDLPLNEYFRYYGNDYIYGHQIFCSQFSTIDIKNFYFSQDEKDNGKQTVIFTTKGNVIYELDDGNDTLECNFLPIQAFVIDELTRRNIEKEEFFSIIISFGIAETNIDKLLNSLDSLIIYKKEYYRLVNKLPFYNKFDYTKLYFKEFEDYLNKIVEKEYCITVDNYISTNILSILKKETNMTLDYHSIESKILNCRFRKDITPDIIKKNIQKMVSKDYITYDNNILIYICYTVPP